MGGPVGPPSSPLNYLTVPRVGYVAGLFENLFCNPKREYPEHPFFSDVFVKLYPLLGVMRGFLNMTRTMASQIESSKPKMPKKQLVHQTMKKTTPDLELNLSRRSQRPSNITKSS